MPARSSAPRGPAIVLLGAPFVDNDGVAAAFLPERRFELLAYLAYRGEWIGRDALAALFWPEQDNAGARRNLRWLLHSVRAEPHFAKLQAERERIRLDVLTDVRRFEAAIAQERWQDALALYRGALCSGLDAKCGAPFAQWLRLERARLAEMFRRAAFALIASVEPDAAAAVARRLLAEDAFDEPAMQALLRALVVAGRSADARRAYSEFAGRMLDELGLEPGNETRTIVAAIDAGAPAPLPPLPSAPAAAHDSFVGRRAELAQLTALLDEADCRLLTILGPGGIGKSRLLLRAFDVAGERQAVLVRLEALTVPAQIPVQVAAALDLRLSGGEEVERQVARRLRAGRVTLALDNFEHLIDGAKICERWLRECPELKIVVTSRERLDVAGEWILPLEGLALPRGDTPPDAVDKSDAVRLFVERARAARPDFELAPDREHVRDIVTLTDGMPLALELAAAWTRILPCDAIAQDLRKGLDILDASRPPPRPEHRSIRASFEHSWSLLLPRERTVLAALSVFRGSFTREAAQAIAGSSLPALSALVDKSLLRASRRGRFSLHPLLRQFAEEKLAQDETLAGRMRALHAEYFAHRIAAAADGIRAGQDAVYAETTADLDNHLEAWRFALAQKRFALVEQACVPLMKFYQNRGLAREGLQLLAASDRSLQEHGGLALAHVTSTRAGLLLQQGRYAEAGELAHAALKAYRAARDDTGMLRCLTTIGESLWQQGLDRKAKPYFDQILRKTRAAGDANGAAGALVSLGVLERAAGRYASAIDLLDESARLCREVGNANGLVTALNNLGNICRLTRDFERARRYLEEGLAVAGRIGLGRAEPYLLFNLGVVELELGKPEIAQVHAAEALARVRASGDTAIETLCACSLARIAAARNSDDSAAAHLADAARVSRRGVDASTVALCAAQLLAMRGKSASAATIFAAIRDSPEANAPDRSDAERELDALGARMSADAIASARSDATRFSIDALVRRIADGCGLDAAASGLPSALPRDSQPPAPLG